jgi:outer membrane receptor protein involved in Fe transport
VLAGVRYEKTDITSSTQAANPAVINWTGDDDFTTTRSDTLSPFSQKASYSHVLPSLDFDISLTDDLKGRLSVSKTIARPTYGNLRADIGVGDFRNYTADSGSPGLLPLESKNFDLSVEWCYGKTAICLLVTIEKTLINSTVRLQSRATCLACVM